MNSPHSPTVAPTASSQCDRILAVLQAAPAGEWVPMPKLASAGRCYAVHSRISDLRRCGHDIEHKNLRVQDRSQPITDTRGRPIINSFYRLKPPQLNLF